MQGQISTRCMTLFEALKDLDHLDSPPPRGIRLLPAVVQFDNPDPLEAVRAIPKNKTPRKRDAVNPFAIRPIAVSLSDSEKCVFFVCRLLHPTVTSVTRDDVAVILA